MIIRCAMIVGLVAAFTLVLHGVLAAAVASDWVKGSLCIACHTATNKQLVTRFKTTKHATTEIKPDEMKPVDIYRRSVGFDPETGKYFEKGVGCQACHGPGQEHAGAKSDKKKETIVNLVELKTARQKLSVCGRCHGQYTYKGLPFVPDFKPGMDLFELEGFELATITEPGPFQQLNELQSSKHSEHDVTCITCHTSHEDTEAKPQLRKAVPELCLDCHRTEHPCTVPVEKWGEGQTCTTCHMPNKRHIFAVKP